jgi:protein-disulfide isomerase
MSNTLKTVLSVLALVVLAVLVWALLHFAPQSLKAPATPAQKDATGAQAPKASATDVSSFTFDQTLQTKLASVAETVGLSKDTFQSCVASEETRTTVLSDVALGDNLGMKGTPYFAILLDNGTAYSIPGSLPEENFYALLSSKKIPDGFSPLEGDILNQVKEKVSQNTSATVTGPKGKFSGVHIVEMGDIDCYYCQLMQPFIEKAVAQGAAWTFLHYPITSLHPNAYNKALAAECVLKNSNPETFFKFVDLLML